MVERDGALADAVNGATRAYGAREGAGDEGVDARARGDGAVVGRKRARVVGRGLLVVIGCAFVASVGTVRVVGAGGGRTRATAALGAADARATLPENFFGELDGKRVEGEASNVGEAMLGARAGARGTRKGGVVATWGVPGLREHVTRARGASDDARILVLTKPFEWGLTYLQIASIKRWAPALLPHVTVLTYDDETQRSCEGHRGVDCFYDEDFASKYGKDTSSVVARNAMSWRKVHAALELLKAQIPVVVLDSDTVFLSDPTAAWMRALEKYDVVVSADVGNELEAQGNMNTKLVIFPATARSVEICEKWIEGENRLVSKVNFGEFPEQSFWNYVLVPTNAGKYHIHAMSTAESSNFITANAGRDQTFAGTHTVSASYCGDWRDKEQFLQHVLETKHNAEASLGIGPSSASTRAGNTALPLRPATDFDHDGVADAAGFPHPDLKCDHVKRRLVDHRRYQITADRHIVWT